MATPYRASAPAAESADHVARRPVGAALRARVRRRIGLPLLLLLIAALVEALAWTIALPPLEGPDEIGHFAYTQRIVETRTIPWHPSGRPAHPGPATSTEAGVAARDAGVFVQSGNIAARPPGSKIAAQIWERDEARLRDGSRSDGGFATPMGNPPLYYLFAAIPYVVTYPLDFFDRVFAMRLANIPLLLAIVALTWGIAGLLLTRIWQRTLATAAVALNPQLSHMTAVINPDLLLAAEWTAFFYLGLLALMRGPTRGRLAGMALLAVAACLTHGRGIALLLPTAVVFAILWWRRRPRERRDWVAALAAGAAFVVCGAYVVLRYATLGELSARSLRQGSSYLWQFYLPKLSFMSPMIGPHWTARQALLDRFFGSYAQLEVTFTPDVLDWIARIAVVMAVLAIVGLVVRVRASRDRRAAATVILVLLVGVAAYMVGMHVAAYRSLASGSLDPVITGRYLLPLISIYGLGIALAVGWLPRRVGAVAGAVVLAGLCVLQIGAMGILVERFYA
jgi:4-amino-4-deoxy-L-arabinose transferase-like glycosyltransferase